MGWILIAHWAIYVLRYSQYIATRVIFRFWHVNQFIQIFLSLLSLNNFSRIIQTMIILDRLCPFVYL